MKHIYLQIMNSEGNVVGVGSNNELQIFIYYNDTALKVPFVEELKIVRDNDNLVIVFNNEEYVLKKPFPSQAKGLPKKEYTPKGNVKRNK